MVNEHILFYAKLASLLFIALYATSNYADISKALLMQETKNAWDYYENNKFSESRKIVDKYYTKDNEYLAVLSGLLYMKEGACEKALESIDYLEKYYDKNIKIFREHYKNKTGKVDRRQINFFEKYYEKMKVISSKCNFDLEKWGEAIKDITALIQYHKDDEHLFFMLANSYMKLSDESFEKSILDFEKVKDLFVDNDKKVVASTDDLAYYMAVIHAKKREGDKTIKLLEDLLKNTKDKKKWSRKIQSTPDFSFILKDRIMVNLIAEINASFPDK